MNFLLATFAFVAAISLQIIMSTGYSFEDCQNHNFPSSVRRHGPTHTEGSSCYMILDRTNKNQPEAEEWCHQLGAQLAVLHSPPALLFQPKSGAATPSDKWVWRNWDGTTTPLDPLWWNPGEPNDWFGGETGVEDSGLLLGNLGKMEDRPPGYSSGPRPLCQFQQPTECAEFSLVSNQKVALNILPLNTEGMGERTCCGKECLKTTICRAFSVAKNGSACLLGAYSPITNPEKFEVNVNFDSYFRN